MKNFKDFTNLYSLSKTLRFELKPIGKTISNIEKGKFLQFDKQRIEDYKRVKLIIDKYHKAYIEERLADFALQYDDNGNKNSLSEYNKQRNTPSSDNDVFVKIQDNLRKQISKHLCSTDEYKRIFTANVFRSPKQPKTTRNNQT